jgi:hypothetical protein
VLALVVAVVAVAGVVVTGGRKQQHWPKQWDARIQPIVNFVEYKRGLSFRHPVQVDFLPVAEFQRKVGDNTSPSAKDRLAMDHTVAALRAVGLIHGNVDLQAAGNQLVEQGVIGVYLPKAKRVYVRGTELSPYGRVTLAHELTHALQDQYTDLQKLENLDYVSSDVVRSLIEGDAVRVERAYADALSAADKTSYQKDSQADGAAGNVTGIPDVLTHSFAFPYAFGPTFVDALVAFGGTSAIDRALRSPPATEAEIISPDRYLARTPITHIDAPALAPGDHAYDKPSEFGQAFMLEVLGNVVGYADAWRAVGGWQADQAVSYSHGPVTCIAVATELDTGDRAAAFVAAANRWAQTVPGATVKAVGTTVALRSCDPGPGAPPHPSATPAAFDVLQIRAQIIDGSMGDGRVSPAVATCAADKIIEVIGPPALMDLNRATADDPRVAQLRRVAAAAGAFCAGGSAASVGA